MADDGIEAELETQLAVQREALHGIDDAVNAVGEEFNAELVQMRGELRAAVAELESALLEIKRSRILHQLGVAPRVDGTAANPAAPEARVIAPTHESCSDPSHLNPTTAIASPGALCHFRYMDGRWYAGRLQGLGRQPGTLSVSFEVPTRSFMLDPIDVVEALVRLVSTAVPGPSARPVGAIASARAAAAGAGGADGDCGGVAVGRRALARLPGSSNSSRVFVPVEIVALDAHRGTARVMPLGVGLQRPSSSAQQGGGGGCSAGSSGGEVEVPLAHVTRHAHVQPSELAPDPGSSGAGADSDGDESDGASGDSSSSVSALLRPGLGGGGGGGGSVSDGGSDMSVSDDGDDDDGADEGDDGVDEGDDRQLGEEEGEGVDVFGHARLAAAAGALSDSALLADWEAHSRGVASRLLARMGYVRGRGLGSNGQGTMDAPEVLLLPERKGLGAVDRDRVRRLGGSRTGGGGKGALAGGVAKRRKRGGAREKRKRAIAASREARREVREREEGAPGGGGLFGFLNSSLGDSSAAARVRRAQVALPGAAGGSSDSEAGTAPTAGAAAIAGAVVAASGGPPRAPADRRGLMSHHDHVAGIQTKLARLREMLSRNKGNAGLRTQIEGQIRAAQAELSAAQSAAARVSKAISDKDAQNKWLKF